MRDPVTDPEFDPLFGDEPTPVPAAFHRAAVLHHLHQAMVKLWGLYPDAPEPRAMEAWLAEELTLAQEELSR